MASPVHEICGNGLDDDGDGQVDCRDDDCPACVDLSGDEVQPRERSGLRVVGAPGRWNRSAPA